MRHRDIVLAGCLGVCTGFALFFMIETTTEPQSGQREPSSATSATSEVTCRLQTSDVGEIIGRGSDKNSAFANAAEKCYLKREAKFEHARGKHPGTEQGEEMVISCVNLTCRYDVSSL